MRLRHVGVIFALCLGVAEPAMAQDNSVSAAYSEYNEALASGEFDAAMSAAERAWRLSESSEGASA